jgi:DHA3 family tetracycline resistance protein-like MFS transporter
LRTPTARTVYLVLEAGQGLSFFTSATIFAVFLIVDVGLNPLQLVLLGTVLEGTVLLFEVPTGFVADAVGRRISVITGVALSGVAFVMLGLVEDFPLVVVTQVIWGLGFTFTSGAQEAWITDEVGEAKVGRLFLRGAQAWQFAGLFGIAISVALASIALWIPLVVGGAINLALAAWLFFVMSDNRPVLHGDETERVNALRATFRSARSNFKTRPVLILILAVAVFQGMSTEGFDRLWELHLLRGVGLPALGDLDRVVWFGIIQGVGLILAIAASEFVRRNVDVSSHAGAAGVIGVINLLLIVAVVTFGLAGNFMVALAAVWATALLREVEEPVFAAWLNQGLDPRSRATVNSLWGQSDALGQMAAGPLLGWFAIARSVRFALVVSGVLRAPALALIGRALRKGTVGTLPPEEMEAQDLGGAVSEPPLGPRPS